MVELDASQAITTARHLLLSRLRGIADAVAPGTASDYGWCWVVDWTSGNAIQSRDPADAPPPGSRDWIDRKSTRLNSSHIQKSRMPSSA